MKKLLVLVLLLSLLTFGVGVVSAGNIWASDDKRNDKYTFNPDEAVYLAGEVSTYGDVYVVYNASWNDGDKIADAGVVLQISNVDPNQVNYPNVLFLAYVNNSGGIPYPGKYDIVYDSNRDGYYNQSGDYVDYVACSGFETIPEFTTIALPAAIAMLGAMFYLRRR